MKRTRFILSLVMTMGLWLAFLASATATTSTPREQADTAAEDPAVTPERLREIAAGYPGIEIKPDYRNGPFPFATESEAIAQLDKLQDRAEALDRLPPAAPVPAPTVGGQSSGRPPGSENYSASCHEHVWSVLVRIRHTVKTRRSSAFPHSIFEIRSHTSSGVDAVPFSFRGIRILSVDFTENRLWESWRWVPTDPGRPEKRQYRLHSNYDIFFYPAGIFFIPQYDREGYCEVA